MKPYSLYIHIPYCLHKCPYCDFNTYALPNFPEQEYAETIQREFSHRVTYTEWRERPIRSIYFGGGTPSLFDSATISGLLSTIRSLAPVLSDAEITLEANPGTIATTKLRELRASGVNRLSIGAQSFQPKVLATLGRVHSRDQTVMGIDAAREVGFLNVSLDLLYGVPSQSLDDLTADLEVFASLAPEHISAYTLTYEKGTPYYRSVKKGALVPVSEELVIDMMGVVTTSLGQTGYAHYEISNFAKPGAEAQHNQAYWNGDDYLGLGAGAHSFVRSPHPTGTRWANLAAPGDYMKAVRQDNSGESWRETLSLEGAIFEFFFLGLRKCAGVRFSDFSSRFGAEIRDIYPSLLTVLTEESLLTIDDGSLALTEKGRLLCDSVTQNFANPEINPGTVIPEERRVVSTTSPPMAA